MLNNDLDLPVPVTVVKGEYVGHNIDKGFIYKYTCPECRRTFVETSPEVTAPCVCHRCFKGMPDLREPDPGKRLLNNERKREKHRSGYYKKKVPKYAPKKCTACGCLLGIPGGMATTGLCGPCCTGEAEALSEYGESW